MYLKLFFGSVLVFLFSNSGFSQILANGDFSGGTTSWGCGVEVNTESTYGGSSSNAVVEVDAGAGLCQTMTGLTIGNAYLVSFSSSRRTGGCPSPAITNIDVTVSGGALFTTITRTNTTFAFSSDYFIFTANATTHTLTFSAGSGFGGSTCGMIMDNFAVSFSPLPITLLDFSGSKIMNAVDFKWSTASEKNNSYFTIERSSNGINFLEIQKIATKANNGNSAVKLDYTARDSDPITGLGYYRLKQIDLDNTFSYSKIISVESAKKMKLYPNPNSGDFFIEGNFSGKTSIYILNNLQEVVYFNPQAIYSDTGSVKIDIQDKLGAGYYYCLLSTGDADHYFPLIIR